MKGQRCEEPVLQPEGDLISTPYHPPPCSHCQQTGHALKLVQLELEAAPMGESHLETIPLSSEYDIK